MIGTCSRRDFLRTAVAGGAGLSALGSASRITQAVSAPFPGHFSPTWDSLSQYNVPEWYRDAKLGTMGYNWRQTLWYPPQHVFYGMHGRSGILFKFDPRARTVEVVTRLVSDVTFKSGTFDRFAYGYLGFGLGPDGHTIYYLTGAPLTSTGGARATSSPAEKTAAVNEDEDIHFVTYDIASGKRVDHGVLQLEDGLRPFFAESIAIGSKSIYTVAKTRNKEGHLRVDLLGFPNPVQ